MFEQNTQMGQPQFNQMNTRPLFGTPVPTANESVIENPQIEIGQREAVPMEQTVSNEAEVRSEETDVVHDDGKPKIDFAKLGIDKEELERTSIKGAEVIRRQYFSHQRDCMVTIRPNGIQFNNACINRFVDTNFILPLIIRDKKQLIIMAAEEDDLESQRWCNEKAGKRVSRKLTGRPVSDRLYSMMGWSKGWYYQIIGSLCIDEDDENNLIMVFNLESFEKKPMAKKTRRNHGVDDDTELSEEEILELKELEAQREAEKAARKAAKEAGEPMPVKKANENFPDDWDKDSFGTSYAEYQPRERLPLLKDAIQSGEVEVLSNK